MGVRLDVGVAVKNGRVGGKKQGLGVEVEGGEERVVVEGGEKRVAVTEGGEKRVVVTEGEEKRFFVNEITRFYGADYFSQHTLGAPQQEVCWAYAEAMDGYFGAEKGDGNGYLKKGER